MTYLHSAGKPMNIVQLTLSADHAIAAGEPIQFDIKESTGSDGVTLLTGADAGRFTLDATRHYWLTALVWFRRGAVGTTISNSSSSDASWCFRVDSGTGASFLDLSGGAAKARYLWGRETSPENSGERNQVLVTDLVQKTPSSSNTYDVAFSQLQSDSAVLSAGTTLIIREAVI